MLFQINEGAWIKLAEIRAIVRNKTAAGIDNYKISYTVHVPGCAIEVNEAEGLRVLAACQQPTPDARHPTARAGAVCGLGSSGSSGSSGRRYGFA